MTMSDRGTSDGEAGAWPQAGSGADARDAYGRDLGDAGATARLGLHILADLHGCAADPALLARAGALRALVERLVDASGMTRLGSTFHQFDPAGATGCVLLAESHVALHTWPEAGFASLDVYVCNHGRDNCAAGRRLADALVAALAPASVRRREVVRDRVA